jgi:hypothetical protein
MQHKWVDAELGDDEQRPLRRQPRSEMHVSGEARWSTRSRHQRKRRCVCLVLDQRNKFRALGKPPTIRSAAPRPTRPA